MTASNQGRHRSIRLSGYDYAQGGVYAFTIVVASRRCCLGRVVGEEFVCAVAGSIVQDVWNRLPSRFATILLDAFVVMPNHVHGIVILGAQPGFGHEVAMNDDATPGIVASPFMATYSTQPPTKSGKPPLQPPSRNPAAPALGEIVRSLKAASTTRIRKECLPDFAWQPGYWDRIVRNDHELDRFRGYIATNPVRWTMDREYSDE